MLTHRPASRRTPLSPLPRFALIMAAGKSRGAAASMIGKWKQAYSDAAVLDALAVAQAEATPDPIALITATLQARNGKRNHHPERFADGCRDHVLGFLAGGGDSGVA